MSQDRIFDFSLLRGRVEKFVYTITHKENNLCPTLTLGGQSQYVIYLVKKAAKAMIWYMPLT